MSEAALYEVPEDRAKPIKSNKAQLKAFEGILAESLQRYSRKPSEASARALATLSAETRALRSVELESEVERLKEEIERWRYASGDSLEKIDLDRRRQVLRRADELEGEINAQLAEKDKEIEALRAQLEDTNNETDTTGPDVGQGPDERL